MAIFSHFPHFYQKHVVLTSFLCNFSAFSKKTKMRKSDEFKRTFKLDSFQSEVFMARIINLLWAVCFALSGLALLSCSSDDGGEKRELSVGKTEDGKDVLVYQEGSLDDVLIRVDAPASINPDSSGTLIFKNMKEDEIPRVGDIISSFPTTNAPHGFLYKALGVSTQDGITAVIVRQARLEEAIENADFESEAEFEFNEDGELLRVLQKTYGGSIGTTLQYSQEITHESDGFGVDLKAEAAYTMKLNFSVKIEWWKLKTAKMSLSQDAKLSLAGKMDGIIHGGERFHIIPEMRLPDIKFMILFIPVVITNDFHMDLKIIGEATVGVYADFFIKGSSEFGFDYDSGRRGDKFKLINDNNLERGFDFDTYINGKIRTSFLVGLTSKLYGVVGFGLAAGPALEFTVNGRPTGTYVYDKGFRYHVTDGTKDNEATLDLGVDIELTIDLGVHGIFGLTWHWFQLYSPLWVLHRTSFLPLFQEPQVSETATGITVASRIERELLNYPIHEYGFCLEKKAVNECEKGRGERRTVESSVKIGGKHDFEFSFDGLEDGATYSIWPYFDNGIGGIFYDKAVVYTHGTPSSSSVVVTPSSSSAMTFTDARDGQVYKMTVIGTQTWMAQNLNYVTSDCGSGSCRCYEGQDSNCVKYGLLYLSSNGTADDVCPTGWHLPSYDEWETLARYVDPGFGTFDSNSAGPKLRAKSGWDNANGTDDYGFAGLPGGLEATWSAAGTGGLSSQGMGQVAYWWMASQAGSIALDGANDLLQTPPPKSPIFASIRCVKD
jgi:uncharacterized protein (TIGR02145 family)